MSVPLSRRGFLRRCLVIGGSVGALGTLAGCGSATGNPSNVAKVVQFWLSWTTPPVVNAVGDATTEFNAENPGITVKPYWGVPMNRSLLAIAGGQPPDVVVLFPGGTLSEWATSGAIRPLSDLVATDKYDLNRFVASQIEHAVFNGKLYALPLGMGAYMLYYNTKIFKDAGLAGPPKTLQDALAMSQKLTRKNAVGYERIGFLPFAGFSGNGWGFPLYAFLFGGSLWDAKAQRFTIDSQTNVNTLRWIADYYKAYGPSNVDEFTAGFGSMAQDPFFAGKLAMEINGQWEVFNAHNFKPSLEYDVAPIPYDEAHPQFVNSTMTRGNSLVIATGSAQVPGAWKFITWMQAGAAPVLMAKAVNNMPAVKSYLTNQQLTSIDPRYARFLAYLLGKNVRPQWPPTPVTSVLANEITADVDQATHLAESPQAALGHAQRVMQADLAAARRRRAAGGGRS